MNKFKPLFLFFILLGASFSCCKDDDAPQSDDEGIFSEYFTCKINGVEFNPEGTFNCNNLSFYYYQEAVGGVEPNYLVMSGFDCPNSKTVKLRFFGFEHQTGYLDFSAPTFADSCSPFFKHYVEPGYEIEMDSLISGSMNITTFTPRDSISEKLGKIEGTFDFTIANSDSIIHITDGAFRFQVPNIW